MSKKTKKSKEHSSEMYMQICPKCKSKEVTHRGMISDRAYSNTNVCMTCGYQGLFPEIPASAAKDLPEQPRNFNPSYMPIFLERAKPRTKILLWTTGVLAVILLLLLLTQQHII